MSKPAQKGTWPRELDLGGRFPRSLFCVCVLSSVLDVNSIHIFRIHPLCTAASTKQKENKKAIHHASHRGQRKVHILQLEAGQPGRADALLHSRFGSFTFVLGAVHPRFSRGRILMPRYRCSWYDHKNERFAFKLTVAKTLTCGKNLRLRAVALQRQAT